MALGFFALVTQSTVNLVTSYGPVFNSTGLSIFRPIAVTLVVWEGFKVAFGHQPANRIASLLVSIAITYSALVFYSTPFPGVGRNLTQVVTDAGADLAQTIDTSTETQVATKIATIMEGLSGSSWDITSLVGNSVRYFVIVFVLSALQIVMLGIIAFGFVAVGGIVLIGPVLIPFLIVPGLDWLATGWFRALIQYSFYPVIGNAFLFVYGTVLLNFLDQWSTATDSPTIAAAFGQIIVLSLAGVFGILKVPQLVAGIFSGHAGISAVPGIGWWR